MARRQLYEFNERSWYPRAFRDAITDILYYVCTKYDIYGPVLPGLKRVLEKLACRDIVDLCSGGSGPLLPIIQQLELEGYPVRATLTDLYPNLEAFRRCGLVSGGRISWVEDPVDAADVPEELAGFRTIFSSFHHFEPAYARMVLQDAVDRREGIGVFEFTSRDLASYVTMLKSPFAILLATPFVKPFKRQRFFWTYVIPLIPLTALWDGLVSNLRTYSPDELRELTAGIGTGVYAWEAGKVRGGGSQGITYLLGYPQSNEGFRTDRQISL